jgi:hypothetical protein
LTRVSAFGNVTRAMSSGCIQDPRGSTTYNLVQGLLKADAQANVRQARRQRQSLANRRGKRSHTARFDRTVKSLPSSNRCPTRQCGLSRQKRDTPS